LKSIRLTTFIGLLIPAIAVAEINRIASNATPLTFITIISFGNIASHSYPTFRTIILISTFRDKDVSVSVDRYRARPFMVRIAQAIFPAIGFPFPYQHHAAIMPRPCFTISRCFSNKP
ncbi:hypothetical protein, partial [Klebsiella pneumoniae]|uniref:hypothetical protein n=1 Tax=Klebsiella pneumoniae TaxID=573 RepID=UPI001619FBA7